MADPQPAPPTPAPPPAAWHTGIDSEIIGHWQAKGWDISDPKIVASEATKAYKGVEKFIGAPPDQMIRIPKDASDQTGWNALYSRLGAPNDPKDYDFSQIKHVDGTAPAQSLVDTIRRVAGEFRVSKDRAPDLAKAVIKHLDDTKAEQIAAAKTTLDTERASLDKLWGLNKEVNRLEAIKGAGRLGFTAEDITNLEKSVGYAKTMEALRRVGATGRESDFVEGRPGDGRMPTSDAAKARMDELMKDEAWRKRLLAGDLQAKQEMFQLNSQIHGYDTTGM